MNNYINNLKLENPAGFTPLTEEAAINTDGGIVGTALKALGATWSFAVNYWGGTREAVQATANFWLGR